MIRLNLHNRLLFSHLLVMVMALLSFSIISKLSSVHLFSRHLENLEGKGYLLRSVREVVQEGFEATWTTSSLLAFGVGVIASAALSYWVAYWINQPLVKMEQVAYRLATGHLQERVPTSNIPELARLGRSLNQMVDALEDAEHRRQEMVTDLSHELRTPITVIRGYLEEIASNRLEATPETCERLVKETRRLERLVNDLQDLSKAESGSLPLSLQPMRVYPLLNALVERFDSQLMEEGPTLKLDCPPNLPAVMADCDRTEQILVNLLGNAIRHTQQGRITVKAWANGYRVWLAVTDTGSGIAPDELPHVFDRFWRSAASRAQQNSGTGIGLTIARQLVELQGGEIFVDSQLGQGSTFRFWLPVAGQNKAKPSKLEP